MSLLLVVILSNQLWFTTQQQNGYYSIVPMVSLTNRCECTLSIDIQRKGPQGESRSRQQRQILLPSNQPLSLGEIKLNITQGDWVEITVALSNGGDIEMTKRWVFSPKV